MTSRAALALNCTLKDIDEPSSTGLLLQQVLEELHEHDVEGDLVRVAALNIKPESRPTKGTATTGRSYGSESCRRTSWFSGRRSGSVSRQAW